jgi:hypothetical protein
VGGIQLIAGASTGAAGQAAPQTATVGRGGRMTVSLGSLSAGDRGARVVARVRVPLSARGSGRATARRSVLATSRVTLGAGESKPLAVRLDRAATRRVARGQRVRVRVELAVTPAGGATVRSTRTFRLDVRRTSANRRR